MLHDFRLNVLEYISLSGRRKGRTFETESPEYADVVVLITPHLSDSWRLSLRTSTNPLSCNKPVALNISQGYCLSELYKKRTPQGVLLYIHALQQHHFQSWFVNLFHCIQYVYTPDVQIQVQNDGNLNFVFEHLIFEVVAVRRESHKTRKVLKIKDFYVSIRCIPITHSTW